jgi:hypothetical protein
MRHFNVWREDGSAESDCVPRAEQAIRFQRLEDVAHGGSSALDRIEIELAGRPGISTHRPHQVFVRDPFIVHKHAVGNWVVVTDDGVHEFVNKGIWLEPEFLNGEWHHCRKKRCTRHVSVFGKPCLQARGDTFGLWHSANSSGMFHHAFALGDRELTKQEVAFSRGGRNPVGIATSGIEKR